MRWRTRSEPETHEHRWLVPLVIWGFAATLEFSPIPWWAWASLWTMCWLWGATRGPR